MTKPFKFKYVNEITGAFVLLVAALLIAAVIIAGHAQQWFEPVLVISTEFSAEGSAGIKRGAEVVILGTPVGRVDDVDVEEDGTMFATLKIVGDFARFVREDSVALIRKKYEVAGDAYIEITRGQGRPLEDGDEIPSRKDTELIQRVNDMIAQIEEKTVPLLDETQQLLAEHRKLAASLNDESGPLQTIMKDLQEIVDRIHAGEGTVGKLLADEETADTIQSQLEKIDHILENIKVASDDLPAMTDAVRSEVGDIEGVAFDARAALNETRILIEGVQRHWLLRKYMRDTDAPEPVTAADAMLTGEVQP